MTTSNLSQEVGWDPYPGKVVVEITETEETYGKIIIPATARETRVIGTVVAVYAATVDDNGEKWEPWCKAGDTVIIGKYTGTEVTIARRKYVIMKENDILARIQLSEAVLNG